MAPYGEDLTFIHDAGFSHLAEAAGALVDELLGDRREGPLVELGCGGGVTAAILLEHGHEVIGYDLSPEQIELARKRAPRADLRVGSFIDAELPRATLAVVAIGEVFNYAFDPRNDADRLRELLGRVYEALLPGGLLVFDLAAPGRVPDPPPPATHREGDGWAITYAAREIPSPPMLVREMTTVRRGADGVRTDRERHHLLLYPREEVVDLLADLGFDVAVRSGYSPALEIPGLPVYVARKPA